MPIGQEQKRVNFTEKVRLGLLTIVSAYDGLDLTEYFPEDKKTQKALRQAVEWVKTVCQAYGTRLPEPEPETEALA